jgi:hypothetical protein
VIRPHFGAAAGCLSAGVMMIVLGVLLVPKIPQLPIELPHLAQLLPISLMAGGLVTTARIVRRRGQTPSIPIGIIAGLLLAYAVILMVGFPAFERAKPIKEIGQFVAGIARPGDRIASYRLNRWTSSWRFYVDRPSLFLEAPEELRRFVHEPGRVYCAMLDADYQQFLDEGLPLRLVYRREGLFVTTGDGLRQHHRRGWRAFVVVMKE